MDGKRWTRCGRLWPPPWIGYRTTRGVADSLHLGRSTQVGSESDRCGNRTVSGAAEMPLRLAKYSAVASVDMVFPASLPPTRRPPRKGLTGSSVPFMIITGIAPAAIAQSLSPATGRFDEIAA